MGAHASISINSILQIDDRASIIEFLIFASNNVRKKSNPIWFEVWLEWSKIWINDFTFSFVIKTILKAITGYL